MLKKILVLTALAGLTTLGFSSTANAADNGIYGNLQLGYGNTGYTSSNTLGSGVSGSVNSGGFAGRIAGGYQFTQNWAAELGYTKFSNATLKNVTALGINFGNATIKEYAIDLVAKGILPLNNGFGVFGTLGGAYLNGNGSANNVSGSTTTSKFWPTFGLGVSYDITNSVPVTASWQRIQRIGSSSNLQSTDLFALGLEYHFG